MTIVHLYIKTHNKTGLKYFGKTINNPYSYNGSGVYWKRHIKKHGNDISTRVYGSYTITDINLSKDAIMFSIDNNIVASNDWANLAIENGLDGAAIGRIVSKETGRKISESNKGRRASEETKLKLSSVHKGVPKTEEHKQKISESNKGKQAGPSHPNYGKSRSEETKRKISESNTGKTLSNETRAKISIAAKNRLKVKCPYCSVIGTKSNMSRWHFDNCKAR